LRPDIIHDLELTQHGFMPIQMPSAFAPMEDGDYLLIGTDRNTNLKEIARHSKHDADAMDQYEYDMAQVCQALKPLVDSAPPNLFGNDPADAMQLADLARRMKSLPPRVLQNCIRLLTGSSADFLDDYFDSDIIKGWLSSSSIIGSKVGPRSQGSGLVLLFHNLGEHDGHFGSWAFHKGGNGGFTQVLARAAQAFGAEIVTDTPVSHVINDNGGTADAGDFTMTVTGSNPNPSSFAGEEAPGTTVTLDAGSYNVSETAAIRIYWGNEGSAVRVGNLDGSSAANLFTGETPCGLAIDSASGKIYWANWAAEMWRVPPSCPGVTTTAAPPSIGSVNSTFSTWGRPSGRAIVTPKASTS
jgi:phytoene dehydrogenase-like protein